MEGLHSFVYWKGLARERRFVDFQGKTFQKTNIRRYLIAGFQEDYIPYDQLRSGNGNHFSRSKDFTLRLGKFLQGIHGLFGLVFLYKTQNGI